MADLFDVSRKGAKYTKSHKIPTNEPNTHIFVKICQHLHTNKSFLDLTLDLNS